jgi:hypothetical protein
MRKPYPTDLSDARVPVAAFTLSALYSVISTLSGESLEEL